MNTPTQEPLLMIKIPEHTWKYSFGGNYWYMVEKDTQPNAIYRAMQRIVLGIKWVRIKQDTRRVK